MNARLSNTEWERVFVTVTQCIECPESPCMRACPQSVNIRDALRLLIDTHPLAARFKALTDAARADPDCGKGCE